MKNGTILKTVTLIMTTVFHKMSFNQCILSVHEGKKSFRVLYVFVIKMFMKMEVNSALSIASS